MGLMKQARQMQSRISEVQEEIAELECDGTAGAGLVTVTLNGKGEVRAVKIDPSLAKPDEVEILEDLVVAAFNDAKTKADTAAQDKMSAITGGMQLPSGFGL
jgi:DNA-binding YbaB/EbfC family protein